MESTVTLSTLPKPYPRDFKGEALGYDQASVLVLVLMGGICPTVILILGHRVNQKLISDDGYMIITLIIICVWSVASSVWELRRSVQRDILPRKRRLEALLKELENQ